MFAGNPHGNAPLDAMRSAGIFRTLLRANEVQDHALARLRGTTIDLLIAPETREFEFSDFTQGVSIGRSGVLYTQMHFHRFDKSFVTWTLWVDGIKKK